MNTTEKIKVMQAYVSGKPVQFKTKTSNGWVDASGDLGWDWINKDYRIKPEEEKPRLMTNRELAEWAIKAKGMIKDSYGTVLTGWNYNIVDEKNSTLISYVLIRPWGSDEWVEPTYDIYERDCKEASSECTEN